MLYLEKRINLYKKKRVTINDILNMKSQNMPITVVTSYDYAMATLYDKAGVDILLVGDSAGMVMLGYDDTIQVTMEQMCMFTQGVSRARSHAMIIADLPFMSYQASIQDAITNSGRLIRAGADAVKLEGGTPAAIQRIKAIVDAGIPVMGHIGVQPQTAPLLGGYTVQGKTADDAIQLLASAKEIEEAGAFSIVLEMVGHQATGIITDAIKIPTIGIGAGSKCSGQVLVTHDMLGIYEKIKPKFVKRYADLSNEIIKAVEEYMNDVKSNRFPSEEYSFSMAEGELEKLKSILRENE